MDQTKQGKTIKSDETLFEILAYLEQHGPARPTEIEEHTKPTKSTIHAHLTTLKQHRFVINDSGEYRIGLEFLNYGKSAQSAYALYPLVHQKVDHLAQETNERAWCQVEENGMAYYLYGAAGEHSVQPPVRVGRSVHLHYIAGGKAMLAYMPQHKVDKILDQHGLPAKTPQTITDRDELLAELEKIRERQAAFNIEESLNGLHAVGVPLRDSDSNVKGALSISGPANRLNGDKLKQKVPKLLLGAANELEINIAYA